MAVRDPTNQLGGVVRRCGIRWVAGGVQKTCCRVGYGQKPFYRINVLIYFAWNRVQGERGMRDREEYLF